MSIDAVLKSEFPKPNMVHHSGSLRYLILQLVPTATSQEIDAAIKRNNLREYKAEGCHWLTNR